MARASNERRANKKSKCLRLSACILNSINGYQSEASAHAQLHTLAHIKHHHSFRLNITIVRDALFRICTSKSTSCTFSKTAGHVQTHGKYAFGSGRSIDWSDESSLNQSLDGDFIQWEKRNISTLIHTRIQKPYWKSTRNIIQINNKWTRQVMTGSRAVDSFDDIRAFLLDLMNDCCLTLKCLLIPFNCNVTQIRVESQLTNKNIGPETLGQFS